MMTAWEKIVLFLLVLLTLITILGFGLLLDRT